MYGGLPSSSILLSITCKTPCSIEAPGSTHQIILRFLQGLAGYIASPTNYGRRHDIPVPCMSVTDPSQRCSKSLADTRQQADRLCLQRCSFQADCTVGPRTKCACRIADDSHLIRLACAQYQVPPCSGSRIDVRTSSSRRLGSRRRLAASSAVRVLSNTPRLHSVRAVSRSIRGASMASCCSMSFSALARA